MGKFFKCPSKVLIEIKGLNFKFERVNMVSYDLPIDKFNRDLCQVHMFMEEIGTCKVKDILTFVE